MELYRQSTSLDHSALMMKATRSSPEPQHSAFSSNSSVTECSRLEHFSPCSCCCRLVTERLDAGPSRCSLNDQSGPQFQRAASTTSPNPNVQPSEPTPATFNAADVSTSLRALAAVSMSDQSILCLDSLVPCLVHGQGNLRILLVILVQLLT